MKRILALAAAFTLCLSPLASAQVIGPAGAAAVAAAPAVGAAASVPSLNFGMTRPEMRDSYRGAQARLDTAISGILAAPASFTNTVKAYEAASEDYASALTPLVFLGEVSPDAQTRTTARAIEKVSDRKSVELSMNEALYRKIEEAAARGEKLDPADQLLMDDTLKDFRENGFALAPGQRERLKAMQQRLNTLASDFAHNVSDKKDYLEVGEDGVKGLPAPYVAKLEKTASGTYRIPVDEPNLTMYMRYADLGEARKSMMLKFNNRGGDRNLEILHEALAVRRDMAQLLGFPGYPEMVIKDKMAETPANVYAFLGRLKDAVLGRARSDAADLLEIKRRYEPGAAQVFAWESQYYARILKTERYAFDQETVKQYFPVDRVVEGTMKVYQQTLGVTFREVANPRAWAPGVRLFEISDTKSGRLIGHFYLDLTPRPGKHDHPAAFPLRSGRVLADGSYQTPVSAMVADFPEPEPGRPSLLYHGDVETFFHEFGHLMHGTLTQARYASYAGTRVARDFVEAPSQMLENFVWEPAVLAELSGHWQDGSKLPDDLFAKMLAARDFQMGRMYAGQIGLAMGDMVLHATVPDDVSAAFNAILEEYTGVPRTPGNNFVGSFGHLLGGYGAGYYGYLWSKVFAQDIYSFFKADGVISPRVGARYRNEILAWGSERPEKDSLRAFLGREPSEAAFMEGLRGAAPAAAAPAAEPTMAELQPKLEAVPGLAAYGIGETHDRPGERAVIVFADASAPADVEAQVRAALAGVSLPIRVIRPEPPQGS
jgi:thimet oligopeptidase